VLSTVAMVDDVMVVTFYAFQKADPLGGTSSLLWYIDSTFVPAAPPPQKKKKEPIVK
jgi:hypothetical protein